MKKNWKQNHNCLLFNVMILHILTHSGKTLNCRPEPGHIKTPQSYGIKIFKHYPDVSRIQMHTLSLFRCMTVLVFITRQNLEICNNFKLLYFSWVCTIYFHKWQKWQISMNLEKSFTKMKLSQHQGLSLQNT